MSLTLNAGYYICNSKSTIHMYSSCCAEKPAEETCCSSPTESSDVSIEQTCCDKIDIETSIVPVPKDSTNELNDTSLYSLYGDTFAPVKTILICSLIANTPDIPLFDRSDTYKVLCSYLC